MQLASPGHLYKGIDLAFFFKVIFKIKNKNNLHGKESGNSTEAIDLSHSHSLFPSLSLSLTLAPLTLSFLHSLFPSPSLPSLSSFPLVLSRSFSSVANSVIRLCFDAVILSTSQRLFLGRGVAPLHFLKQGYVVERCVMCCMGSTSELGCHSWTLVKQKGYEA